MAINFGRFSRKVFLLFLVGALLLSACGRDEAGIDREGATTKTDSKQQVEQAIRDSIEAENEKDVDAFLALWTDKGLKDYDVGSREDLKAGKSENFGREKINIVALQETEVEGKKAQSTVDAEVGEPKFAQTIERVKMALINRDGKWLIDGFQFLGGPPAAAGTASIDVDGTEYAFALSAAEISGKFAMRFKNSGKEPHEITMFKGPDGVSLAAAKAALEKVDGQNMENVPAGYQAEHVSFAEPGKTSNVAFSGPLPAGTYFLACYIPEGGFNENGPVNPNGKPHIALGMISMLKVN